MKEWKENIEVKTSLQRSMPFLSSFLESSSVIHLAVLDRDGGIRFANLALSQCLKVDCATITGQNVVKFLTAPDGELLAKRLAVNSLSPMEELLLNVVDTDNVPHSLRVRIASVEDSFLMLGEPPTEDNQALQEELFELNNELSVLSRENAHKSRQLAGALAELKTAQSMLVHREKMASLGQMTAGIAHEINNPLAFVLGNEQVLRRDFNDLLRFINTLGDLLPEIAVLSPRIHSEIIGRAGEVGLEYLAESVPRKIDTNIEGLERVKSMVLDLRSFSRLDESEQKYCDVSESINSTIRFLGSLLHEYGVTVETDYGQLPQLLCSPGPLNQAINNVLANAIQASEPGQTVRVSTRLEGEWYCVEITDNGVGIPADQLAKVFDPFFTTKPVGSGTGLGLSITHQIISAHGGRIELDSRPGSGTCVRILLPQQQPAGAADAAEMA